MITFVLELSENTSATLPEKNAETTQHKSHHFGNSSPPAPNKSREEALPSSFFCGNKECNTIPDLALRITC